MDLSELKRLAHEASEGEVEWLDADEWRAVMAEDWADFVAACTPEAVLALIAENERLARELAFTEQWYAVRMERLGDLGKGRGIWPEMAAIIANGTFDHQEPPTYAQQLVRANHRAKEAESERDQLRVEVEGLRKRAKYWTQRAKSAEGHLFSSDCHAAARELHKLTGLSEIAWDDLTDSQRVQIQHAAARVIGTVNARRDDRLPADSAMSKGGQDNG